MKELVDLATYLAAQGCGKIVGTNKNIFVSHMPATVKSGILIRPDYLGTPYDHELPGYYRTSFQVIVRDPGHAEGQTLADKVCVILNKERTVIGSMQVHYIRPSERPYVYPASEGDYLEFSTYFDACYLLAS